MILFSFDQHTIRENTHPVYIQGDIFLGKKRQLL